MSAAPLPRLAVTGANGFIGRRLVALARARGHAVVALARSDGSLPGGYEDEAALARACEGVDAVLHLAARAHVGGPDAAFEGNVRAARAVARAARAAGAARFVLLSSIGVNGNRTRARPFDESDPPAPTEPYARSKLRCEECVQEVLAGSGTRWTIARPPLVYGPDAPGNFGRLVRAVAGGWPLPLGAVHNRRSLIGVASLADALLLCASHPAAADALFLLAEPAAPSSPDIVRCIARGLGVRPRLWSLPPALLATGARLAGRPRLADSLCASLQVDASRAMRALGWTPGDTLQGLVEAARSSSR